MASFVENVNKVAALIPAESVDLGVVADNIDNINLLKPVITDLQSIVNNVVPNIAEILLADDNAATATTKAGKASTSASEALGYRNEALGFRNEAEAFNESKAFVVDTVEDLLTIPSSYVTAVVRDLNRGGTFIWSPTGTANGGTVLAGATGYWTRQYSGAVNVKWFGAKGDGITDDTAAIQNAILNGGLIYIPKGVFPIDGIEVGNKSFSLVGECWDSVLKHKSNTVETNAFNMGAADGVFEITNLTINGNRDEHISPPASVRFFSAPENPNGISLTIQNCNIIHIHTGAVWIQTDNISRATLRILDNRFYDIAEGLSDTWNPTFIQFSENIDFEANGNSFFSGYQLTQDGACAISHTSGNAYLPVNEYARVRISNNYFEGLGRNAPITGNRLGCIELRLWTEITVITGNNFKDCYATPIRGKTDCKEIVISGNSIDGCNGQGIVMLRGVSSGPIVGDCSITGNVVVNANGGGIHVEGGSVDISKNWVISGNVIKNCGSYGINTVWANNVCISDNVVNNSTDIGIRAQNVSRIVINSNVTSVSGGRSGIEVVNAGNVAVNNNQVDNATDVGIRVGGIVKCSVNGNIVFERQNATSNGNNIDYKITSGNTCIIANNIGANISSFGFTKSVIVNNEWQ